MKVIALPTGGTFQTSPPVTGAVTGYLWKQNGGPMPSDPRYTGWAGKTLKIAKLIESDAGDYACDVITAGGTLPTTARLIVYNAKPVIHTPGPAPEDPIVMSEAIVGGNYFWLLPIDGDPLLTPTSFTATGLPAGLVINKTNGVVSGVPKVALTAAKDYAVTFTASNAKGKATAKATLRLHPLPANTTGTYAGPVAREGGFYSGLGGRVDLTIQSTGAYSGKLLLAGTSLSFKGSLNTALGSLYPTATTAIKRKNLPDLVVRFTVDTANHRLTDAELDDGSVTPAFTAWRSRWGTAMPAEDLAALQASASSTSRCCPPWAIRTAIPRARVLPRSKSPPPGVSPSAARWPTAPPSPAPALPGRWVRCWSTASST